MDDRLPRFFRVRQRFRAPVCPHPAAAVHAQVAGLRLAARVTSGQSAAVTVGSRGIPALPQLLKQLVAELRDLGLEPFLFPCMGSHGGATAEGQTELLRGYGVTEAVVGAPIRATMDTVTVGRLDDGTPVLLDAFAAEADHLIIVNKVKPHPCYSGPVQSGLLKMMMIGLGNHRGATLYHRALITHGFQPLVRAVAEEVLRRCPVLFGLAILENAHGRLADVVAVAPDDIMDREPKLLKRAGELMPGLPFPQIDLLVVDEIGKNISGAGMDTNLVGRGKPAPTEITRIYVRGLTPESHGNASGIGWADFCHQRVVDEMDVAGTWMNALTSGFPESVALPIHYPSDRECLAAALATVGLSDPPDAKVVWIKNTKQLGVVAVSEAYRSAVEGRRDLEAVSGPADLHFDESGNVSSPVDSTGNSGERDLGGD